MNDQDIIRKAVELADGWEPFNSVAVKNRGEIWWIDTHNEDETAQATLDALAAQLVRQVDALDDQGIFIKIGQLSVQVFDDHNGVQLSNAHHADRTMNTIRAIVESKVLENESND